jgi:hypothetical protein
MIDTDSVVYSRRLVRQIQKQSHDRAFVDTSIGLYRVQSVVLYSPLDVHGDSEPSVRANDLKPGNTRSGFGLPMSDGRSTP